MNWRQILRHPSLAVGVTAAAMFALLGLVSLWWTPYPIEQISIARRFLGPMADHWLGTDHLGRDMLSLATNPIPIKCAMQMLGLDSGELRLPMTELEEDAKARLRRTLTAYGLL